MMKPAKKNTASSQYIGSAGADADGEVAEAELRHRHAGQAVLAAGVVGQRRVLEEVCHLAERQRDHGEVDADAPHREPADQQPEQPGGDGADGQREPDAADDVVHQQLGGDEAAGAVERRLAERQQAGPAEQQVEAEAEDAPVERCAPSGRTSRRYAGRRTAGSAAPSVEDGRLRRREEPPADKRRRCTPSYPALRCRTGLADAPPAAAPSRRTASPPNRRS